MKLHPLLTDPNAGARALAMAQVALEDEKAVIKPNVTAGERFA